MLDGVHPWDIIKAHYNNTSYEEYEMSLSPSVDAYRFSIYGDYYMMFAFALANASHDSPALDSLLDFEGARDFMVKYYQRFAAVLTRQALMTPASISSTGSAWVYEDRLVVHQATAHTMSALIMVAFGLLIYVWLTSPLCAILPLNPSSLLGTTTLLSQSHLLLESLHHSGPSSQASLSDVTRCWHYYLSDEKGRDGYQTRFEIKADLQAPDNDDLEVRDFPYADFRPLSFHPAGRSIIVITLCCIISVLEITLRKSQQHNGLGDAHEDTYVHFAWTTCPAMILGLFGVYFRSVDFDTRSLTPYLQLRKGSSFESSMALDLLDSCTHTTVFKELRSKSFVAFAATIAVAFTSLLPIFSASVFYAEWAQDTRPVQLEMSDFTYLPSFIPNESSQKALLILMSNLTYPSSTYEDLVFPNIVEAMYDRPEGSSSLNETRLVTTVKTTAFRSHLECRLYDDSRIWTHLTINSTRINNSTDSGNTFNELSGSLQAGIEDEICWVGRTFPNMVMDFGPTSSNVSYFGISPYDGVIGSTFGCSDWLWVWGQWNLTADNRVTSINALGCNETLNTVETDTTLLGRELTIDPKNPPIPNERTNRVIGRVQPPPNIYVDFPLYSFTDYLGACFTMATKSRYAIPVEYLGMATKATIVADAVRFQHSIIRAQIVADIANGFRAHEYPYDYLRTSPNLITFNGTQNNGTVTDPLASRRVIQDPVSTRILQALLAATVLASGLSWLLMGSTRILPRKPSSIASVAALLAGSNIFDYLSGSTPCGSADELARNFGEEATFWLGWRQRKGQSEVTFAIYVDTVIQGDSDTVSDGDGAIPLVEMPVNDSHR